MHALIGTLRRASRWWKSQVGSIAGCLMLARMAASIQVAFGKLVRRFPRRVVEHQRSVARRAEQVLNCFPEFAPASVSVRPRGLRKRG